MNRILRLGAKALASGIIVSLVAGCRVGPRYQKPVVALQPYHSAPTIQPLGSTESTSLDVWWTGFHDPELTKLVEQVLRQNLDLAASYARVQQANATAKAAGAQLAPTASLNAQSNSFRQSLESQVGRYAGAFPDFSRNQSYLDLGIAASWEIDLFGGLRRGAEAATAEAQVAEAQHLGTRVSLVAETADAYMQVRGAQARLMFAREQIDTDEHLLRLVKQRRTAEVASDRELAQAEAVLYQARATVPPLLTTLEAQKNRLDVLAGVQPGTLSAELETGTDFPAIPPLSGYNDASDLLRRRPDVVAAERKLAASNARIGQALAEYYPKISLSALLGSESINPGDLFRERGFQPSAVAGLRWRLFDFGRVDAEVKQARGANAEALAAYRESILRAAEDVENSFTALAQSQARAQEVRREIDSLQRVKDRSQEAYQAGVIALTDVLDADRQLLVAHDDLALARENAARAAVGSFRALGGGWKP